MLRLLNYADMITGPAGEHMTTEQSIEDIAERYGEGSWQDLEARKFAENLSCLKTGWRILVTTTSRELAGPLFICV